MVVIMLGALSGLIFLLGLSVYTALVIAKKTDELILHGKRDDEPVLVVSFPRGVFRAS